MIAGCASSGTPSLARDLLANADCLISSQIEAGYAALLAPGGMLSTVLTIGLTIYVAIVGYRLILGQAGLTLGELVPHFIKIGLVLALVTSWASYQAVVFNLLFHGPEQLAAPILRQVGGVGTNGGDVLAALQEQFDRMTDYASDAWSIRPATAAAAPVAPPFPGGAGAIQAATPAAGASLNQLASLGAPQFVAAVLWLTAAIMLASSVGVLLVVRILLALLLVVGPVFVAFALFAATRGLFEGWLRMAVKFALVPLFTLPMIAALVAILAPFVAGLDDGAVVAMREGPVPVIVVIVLVFAAVMFQLTRLTAGIAGGIRLPRNRAVIPAASITTTTAGEMRVINAVAAPSRAELLVQTLRGGGSQSRAGFVPVPAVEALTATRRIAGTVDTPQLADSSGRLGQGYRRLAIGSTPAPAQRGAGR